MTRYYFRAAGARNVICVDTYLELGELLRVDEQLRTEYDLEGSRPFYETVMDTRQPEPKTEKSVQVEVRKRA